MVAYRTMTVNNNEPNDSNNASDSSAQQVEFVIKNGDGVGVSLTMTALRTTEF